MAKIPNDCRWDKGIFCCHRPAKKYFEELEGEGKLHEVFQFLKDFADHCEAFPGQKMDKQAKMESITESDEQE